jgi:hypothetical protein|tara:strand:+ start:834 stop:3362 length:2529 start_codon:yes stop_codon:yes gene_type:complete
MAVDKALTGLEMSDMQERMKDNSEEIEISIENPDSVAIETEDGGMLIDFDPNALDEEIEFGANLAEYIEENILSSLGSELVSAYQNDKSSRGAWEKSYINGLEQLGLKTEDRSTPWPGACGVHHPMLSEAVVRFQSQAITEIFPASGPAKTKIVGKITPEKEQQATRVQDYMNYLLTDRMTEYRSEMERLLFSLPLAGSAFKKIYYDQSMQRPCAMFVPSEDMVVFNGATDITSVTRLTHIMRKSKNEIRKLQVNGFYRDIDLPSYDLDLDEVKEKYGDLTGDKISKSSSGSSYLTGDSVHTLLEMHVELDLDDFEDEKDGEPTGIALPYVVTVDRESTEILSIKRNWFEDDKEHMRRDHFVHYEYLPGLGFYGLGLIHLIGGLVKSATSLLRQLVDAGTLANLPGGLKTRGMRVKGDDTPIMPGEFRDVDVPGGSIKENITFLPHKEPSPTLFQLLGNIVEEGRRFAAITDVKASDMNSQAPVGTTLAILEKNMKVMSAIQSRLHTAIKKELAILVNVIKDFGPPAYPYELDGEENDIEKDFDQRVDVIPVSNPNAATMGQRIMQYQSALQLSAQAPQLYDLPTLHRQMLEVLGITDVDQIVPSQDNFKPKDPVAENMDILNSNPVKSFEYQDHDAHIKTHMSMMEDPEMQQMMQTSTMAQSIQGAFEAHITEHLAFKYRKEIEQELGIELPEIGMELPEEVESRLSALISEAAEQLLGKQQQEKQQEQNEAAAQDPIVQMQQEELAIEKQKVESKIQTDQTKTQIDQAKLLLDGQKEQMRIDLEKLKIDSNERIEGAKIGAKITERQAELSVKEQKISADQETKGAEIGSKIADQLLKGQ